MSMFAIRKKIAENRTAIEIQASFMVSAPEAVRTVDLILRPVVIRYLARRYFITIEVIRMIMVGIE